MRLTIRIAMNCALKQLFTLALALVWVTPSNAEQCDSLATLDWMLGEWVSDSPKRTYHESWWHVSDHTFEGQSLVHRANRETPSRETLRLVSMSGELFYLAKVAENVLPIAFKLSTCEKNSATFTNLEHDFPQLIRYTRTSDRALEVEVGTQSEIAFTIEFELSLESTLKE